MAFDVEGAKQAGYSDAEIAGHLADHHEVRRRGGT